MDCEDVPTLIWNKTEPSQIAERLNAGLQYLNNLQINNINQKITKSSFSRIYKFVKTCTTTEPFWSDPSIDGWMKEIWTRIRCGNYGKAHKKSYRNTNCRICTVEPETLIHLFICVEARKLCSNRVTTSLQNLTEGNYEADLDTCIRQLLRGPPIKEICIFFKEIERRKYTEV